MRSFTPVFEVIGECVTYTVRLNAGPTSSQPDMSQTKGETL